MALIPSKIPKNLNDLQAGSLFLDTDRNQLLMFSDGKLMPANQPTALEGWVNVKDFGAKGDGVTDDTAAIQAAINELKNVTVRRYVYPGNSYFQNRKTLYFPEGIYKVSGTLTIDGTYILITGTKSSFIVQTAPNTPLFKLGTSAYAKSTIEYLTFLAGNIESDQDGIIINRFSDYDQQDSLVCFDMTANSGTTSHNTFFNITVMNFNKVFDVGGTVNRAEHYIASSVFHFNHTVLYMNNSQAMNWKFNHCHMESNSGNVIHVIAGGYITFEGGSYINGGDFLVLDNSKGFGIGIGSQNGHFTLRDLRFEMYQNFDPNLKPKLIKSINGEGTARIVLDNINNLAASTGYESENIIDLFGNYNVRISNSVLKGIVKVHSQDGIATQSGVILENTTVTDVDVYYAIAANKNNVLIDALYGQLRYVDDYGLIHTPIYTSGAGDFYTTVDIKPQVISRIYGTIDVPSSGNTFRLYAQLLDDTDTPIAEYLLIDKTAGGIVGKWTFNKQIDNPPSTKVAKVKFRINSTAPLGTVYVTAFVSSY